MFDGGGDEADWRLGLGAVTGGDFSRESLELWWWTEVAWTRFGAGLESPSRLS